MKCSNAKIFKVLIRILNYMYLEIKKSMFI